MLNYIIIGGIKYIFRFILISKQKAMIHDVDKILKEHRERRRAYEGNHIYADVARYFRCLKCNDIVCNGIEQVPDYFYGDLNELKEIVRFLFDNEVEIFNCPSCKANIGRESLYFAHFFIPSYPYDKDLIVELAYKENELSYSYSLLGLDGKAINLENFSKEDSGIFHPSKKAFQKGMQAMQNNEIKKAIRMFHRALHYYAYWEEALIELARCYLLLGRRVRAEKTLNDVLKSHPENVNALLLKSWLLYINSDLAKSERVCRKILALKYYGAEAYYYLALIQIERGQIEGAVNYLQKALEVDPQHRDAVKLLYMISEEGVRPH